MPHWVNAAGFESHVLANRAGVAALIVLPNVMHSKMPVGKAIRYAGFRILCPKTLFTCVPGVATPGIYPARLYRRAENG